MLMIAACLKALLSRKDMHRFDVNACVHAQHDNVQGIVVYIARKETYEGV